MNKQDVLAKIVKDTGSTKAAAGKMLALHSTFHAPHSALASHHSSVILSQSPLAVPHSAGVSRLSEGTSFRMLASRPLLHQ